MAEQAHLHIAVLDHRKHRLSLAGAPNRHQRRRGLSIRITLYTLPGWRVILRRAATARRTDVRSDSRSGYQAAGEGET
jgi:hypothetical protein